jgi:HPt (histidine-containing phosphotransfer) domain-containing protein
MHAHLGVALHLAIDDVTPGHGALADGEDRPHLRFAEGFLRRMFMGADGERSGRRRRWFQAAARTRDAASKAGVCLVLTKPVAPGSLREIVKAHAAPTPTEPCTTLLNEGHVQAFLGEGLNLDEQRSLLARWRAGMAEQLSRLYRAAQTEDARRWAEELHRLRGAAALCGALRLSAAAAGMETAAPSPASVTLLECINQDTNAALARRVGLTA